MKLKWDISCPTYIEFLPFIYDILDSSLQEDIGKGNQVRNHFRFYFRFGLIFGRIYKTFLGKQKDVRSFAIRRISTIRQQIY